MIKNIIFDWSGVISDDLSAVHKTVQAIFNKFGVEEISLEEFKREWEQPYMLFYSKYGISRLPGEEEMILYRSLYKSIAPKYPPRPHFHIKDTLQRFKKAGVNMIVVSSTTEETILSNIAEFDLQGLFNEINGGIYDKAEIIQEVIKKNQFNPKETVFIGDTTHEIETGKSVDIMTVAVTWGYQNEDKLKSANPDFILHNLKELEAFILDRTG